MRGEFKGINYADSFDYDISTGLFFDGNDVYLLEAYEGGSEDSIAVKLSNSSESYTAVVLNNPGLHGKGANESLSLSSEEAQLPDTDEAIEAYARYALQEDDQDFNYEGPRELDEIF